MMERTILASLAAALASLVVAGRIPSSVERQGPVARTFSSYMIHHSLTKTTIPLPKTPPPHPFPDNPT